jgi:hypothetical protein
VVVITERAVVGTVEGRAVYRLVKVPHSSSSPDGMPEHAFRWACVALTVTPAP